MSSRSTRSLLPPLFLLSVSAWKKARLPRKAVWPHDFFLLFSRRNLKEEQTNRARKERRQDFASQSLSESTNRHGAHPPPSPSPPRRLLSFFRSVSLSRPLCLPCCVSFSPSTRSFSPSSCLLIFSSFLCYFFFCPSSSFVS